MKVKEEIKMIKELRDRVTWNLSWVL